MVPSSPWPGDAKVAGWWLWGQCSWIGSGWCEWNHPGATDVGNLGQKIPHIGSAGMGVQAIGQVPHIGDAGRGGLLTSGGRAAWIWLHKLADRLERVPALATDSAAADHADLTNLRAAVNAHADKLNARLFSAMDYVVIARR